MIAPRITSALIQKDVLGELKHTYWRLRDMQVSLECGLIQREFPQAVIISLRGRHVNGRDPLLAEGLPGTAHPAATVVPLHICDTPPHGLAVTQPPVQILREGYSAKVTTYA